MLSKRRLGPWFLFALLLVLGAISLRIIGVFLDYILIGLFVAYLTFPLYDKLRKYLRHETVSALVMLIIVLVSFIVPLTLIGLELVQEIQDINTRLGYQDPQVFVDDLSAKLGNALGFNATTPGATDVVQDAYDSVRNFLRDQIRALPGIITEASVGMFVLFFIIYYSYTSGEQVLQFLRDLLPMDEGHRDMLLHEVQQVIHGVMVGSVLTAFMQASFGVIGFWIFGVPNAVFWGILMFLLALLPVVGPPIIWAPWGIYLISQGATGKGVGLLIYSAVFVSLLDNFIRPKLIGSVAKIHPVTVLLGVLGGVVVFGLPGFVLGPLVLSIFMTILSVYRKEFASKLNDPSKEVWARNE